MSCYRPKTERLYDFLKLLKETGNEAMFTGHPIIPNRDGTLCALGSLRYWSGMTDDLYSMMKILMGTGAVNMVDPQIITQEITVVGDYNAESLKKDISDTISKWKNNTIGSNNGNYLEEAELNALINLCSSFSLENSNSIRSRLMESLAKIHDKQYKHYKIQRLMDDEEDKFYKTPFNFLVEYTLYVINKKEQTWVNKNLDLLFRFLKEYTTSKKKEDWLDRLDKYAVIPNQKSRVSS